MRTKLSKYKNVTLLSTGRWKSYIRYEGKQLNLGHFDTELEAFKAYNNFWMRYVRKKVDAIKKT